MEKEPNWVSDVSKALKRKDGITIGLEAIQTLDIVIDQLDEDILKLKKEKTKRKTERSQLMSDLLDKARR